MMSISHAKYDSTIGAEKNFLLLKRVLCTKNMMLTDGSIIFGSKRCPGNCFDNVLRIGSIFANESKTQRDLENIRDD